jgi:hypothetical protein
LNGLAAPEIAPIPFRSVLSIENPLWLNLKRQTLVSVAAASEHSHVVTAPIQVTRKLADPNSADNVRRWESERADQDFHAANIARLRNSSRSKPDRRKTKKQPYKLVRCILTAQNLTRGKSVDRP